MTNHKPIYRQLALIFSGIGLCVSLYLVSVKVFPSTPYCFGVGDCEAVNTSSYSEILGIPIALLGALAYAAILASLILETKTPLLRRWGPLFEFGLALAGTLYSAYLTYIEVAVITKICPYCVTSAIAITLVCLFCGLRLQHFLKD